MTVGELRKHLEGFDQDLPVTAIRGCGCCDEAEILEEDEVRVTKLYTFLHGMGRVRKVVHFR